MVTTAESCVCVCVCVCVVVVVVCVSVRKLFKGLQLLVSLYRCCVLPPKLPRLISLMYCIAIAIAFAAAAVVGGGVAAVAAQLGFHSRKLEMFVDWS